MTETLVQSTVLGKRKYRPTTDFVLRLASSPEPGHTDSEYELASTSKSDIISKPILVNGELVSYTKKRYRCTFTGCDKGYTKPSRLEEHERSHTGQRPFVCDTCNKSYLRETHLQAHTRSHLPESSRPLVCELPNCGKRFWTSQHLRAHTTWHNGAKKFTCSEPGCGEAFMKHHHLRTHMCTVHAPPGTKPFQCTHQGCTKSFDTKQHLHTHSKVHDDKRYTCVHQNCLAVPGQSPTYYPTWTSLQHHIRTAHPPTCVHPSCNGKTFSTQKGLRAHEKLHLEWDAEAQLEANEPPRKRRRGGELGRDWKCDVEHCGKDFKSKKALTTHHNVAHLCRRDHVCPHDDCKRTFGYKHLLQRHLVKVHATSDEESLSEREESSSSSEEETAEFDIDVLTGNFYKQQAKKKLEASPNMLPCPYPRMQEVGLPCNGTLSTENCDYVFSRAYDLRRHLASAHEISIEKEEVDAWVKKTKRGKLGA